VLAQLGNRVQHALRAFTPRDQRAVKAAAETFRPNPKLDTTQAIMELGKGEALVSFLEGNGVPSMVERTMIRPPSTRIGPVSDTERMTVIAQSPMKGKYDTAIDSQSAYEILQQRVHGTAAAPASSPGAQGPQGPWGAPSQGDQAQQAGVLGQLGSVLGGIFGTSTPRNQRLTPAQRVTREVTRTVTNRVAGQIAADIGKSLGGSMGGSIGRAIVRGTLGGILRR
jgi:hypothetical protein